MNNRMKESLVWSKLLQFKCITFFNSNLTSSTIVLLSDYIILQLGREIDPENVKHRWHHLK